MIRRAFAVFLLILGTRYHAAAQTVTGTILGSVLDPSGAAIPGAAVMASNPTNGFTRRVTADSAGNYLLTFLPPGTYEVVGSADGFKQTRHPGIVVAADERVRVDFALQLGEATQTVEVTAGAPLVESSDAVVGEVVDSKQIENLPLNKRNFVDLVQLTAGVTEGRPGEAGGETTIDNFRGRFSFSAAGQRSTSNNFILDGVDNNANLFNPGGVAITPIVDSIQEFKISTANFSPEFGRATGGVLSVQMKSGTNQVHGTVFEFLRNSAFDANTFFNNRAGVDKAPLRLNQFGFTVGGPVIRDKTFFFGDFQGFRVRDSRNFISSVPLPGAAQGNFSSSLYKPIYDPATAVPSGSNLVLSPFPGNRVPQDRFDPVGRALAAFYPLPNTNQTSRSNNYITNPAVSRTDNQFDIKIDQRLPANSSFFVRYSHGEADQLWPNNLYTATNPFGGGPSKGNKSNLGAQGVAVNYIRSLTPRWLNEIRLGFTRTHYIGDPLGAFNPLLDNIQIPNQRYSDLVRTIPTLSVSGLTAIGPQGNVPNVSVLNAFQVSENLVYSWGAHHTLKFGFDIIRRQLNNFATGNASGSFSFTGPYTNSNARVASNGGEPFADLLLGLPVSGTHDILRGGFGRRSTLAAGYFQDAIKASRRLTMNLGVRWDLWTPLVEVYDRQANFDVATAKLVLASPDGPLGRGLRQTNWKNFAPRVGLAYTLDSKGLTVVRTGYSISYLEDLTAGKSLMTLNPPFAFSDQITNSQGIIPTRGLKDGFLPPVIPSASNLAGTIVMTIPDFKTPYSQSWNFDLQRALGSDLVLSAGYIGTKGTHVVERLDSNAPYPGPGVANEHRPFYSLYPNMGTLTTLSSTTDSSYHSLQLKLTKRFSHGSSFLVNYTFGKAIEGAEGIGETGVGSAISTMPQDPNNHHAEKALASFDVRQRVVVSYSYDFPFGPRGRYLKGGVGAALLGGWRFQGITSVLDGNPISLQMSSSNLNTGTFQRPNRVCDGSLPPDQRNVDHWFDKSCFVAPPLYVYGNAGRNIITGPGRINFDSSLAREIRVKERATLQFRAEGFNVLNTPQFYPPNSSVGSADFGTISGIRGGSNRQVQFGLRLLY
jgi:hypothetical protein